MLREISDLVKQGFRMDSALGKIREAIYYGLKTENGIPKTTPFVIKEEKSPSK